MAQSLSELYAYPAFQAKVRESVQSAIRPGQEPAAFPAGAEISLSEKDVERIEGFTSVTAQFAVSASQQVISSGVLNLSLPQVWQNYSLDELTEMATVEVNDFDEA